MVILIDTREQKELEFLKYDKRKICLSVGDYSAMFSGEYICPIVFDRKSINDLFGTLSGGYERFKKCIIKAKELDVRLIIIVEVSLSKVLKGCSRSLRSPISIVYQLFTLRARHNVETVFCKDREEMEEYIAHFYLAQEREYLDRIKSERKENREQ